MTYLYRAYGADNLLLYIGITEDKRKRLAAHSGAKKKSRWLDFVERLEFQELPNRKKAKQNEKFWIEHDAPLFNRHHKSSIMPGVILAAGLNLTLAEAYSMAKRGTVTPTLIPLEMYCMTIEQRRTHFRVIKRLGKIAKRRGGPAKRPLDPPRVRGRNCYSLTFPHAMAAAREAFSALSTLSTFSYN